MNSCSKSETVSHRLCRIALIGCLGAVSAAAGPPSTKTVETVEEVHGLEVADPYRWLENAGDSEVIAWMAAQNAYARKYMGLLRSTRAAVYAELKKLFDTAEESLPAIYGDQHFVWRRQGLQSQPVYYVREGSIIAPEKIVLDPNVLSHDGSVAITWACPTPNGKLVAYGISSRGSNTSAVQLRDLTSGKDFALEVELSKHGCRFDSGGDGEDVRVERSREYHVAWEPDGRGFHYARRPAGQDERPGFEVSNSAETRQKAYYHRRGWAPGKDCLVFDPKTPGASLEIYNGGDDLYTLISSQTNLARNDVYFRLNASMKPFRPLVVGVEARFRADIVTDNVYILTDHQAPRGRLMKTSVFKTPIEDWKEIVAQQDDVLRSFIMVDRKLILHYTGHFYSKLVIHDSQGLRIGDIPIPEGGLVTGLAGRWDGKELYFGFESFNQPPANYRYDLQKQQLVKYRQQEIKLDGSAYAGYRLDYAAKDGAKIPMFLIHRKDLTRDGKNPTLLCLFGSDRLLAPPAFNRTLFPWLDRGGIVAVANVRGDGGFGRDWWDAGRLANKQIALDDFVSAAEKLIDAGYTSRGKLAVAGRGADGLPAVALVTQHPDLVTAAVLEQPIADLLRYHRLPAARRFLADFGSPDNPQAAQRLLSYSPYAQVREGVRYPAVLIMTDQADTVFGTMHAWKLGARLQAATARGHSDRPVLVQTLVRAGRGTSKPMRARLAEAADKWAFLMVQLGMIEPDTVASDPRADD